MQMQNKLWKDWNMQHDSEVSLKLEDVSEIIISCKLIKYSLRDNIENGVKSYVPSINLKNQTFRL